MSASATACLQSNPTGQLHSANSNSRSGPFRDSKYTTVAYNWPPLPRTVPALGPGAAPAERLAAFVDAYLSFADRQLDLLLRSETANVGARQRTGSHALWRQHCHHLLHQVAAPHPAVRSEGLLAALSAEQVHHWLRVQQRPLPELAAALGELARTLAAPAGHC